MTAPVKADLHLHTRYSDGAYDPADLVRKARDLRYSTIAVTDHDTVAGVAEAVAEALRVGLRVIPGVEMSTVYLHDEEAHIVGLFVDPSHPALLDALARAGEQRLRRLERILVLLRGEGVEMTIEDVVGYAPGEVIGRMQIAEALVRTKNAGSFPEAFVRFLAVGRPAYVPSVTASVEECCRVIRAAGGVAILAHPGPQVDQEKAKWAMAAGCRALEAYYPIYSRTVTEAWIDLAKKLDLGVSGGSDCHGRRKPRVTLGSVSVPPEHVADLETRRG